jgi:protein-tyrosine-phosphatase
MKKIRSLIIICLIGFSFSAAKKDVVIFPSIKSQLENFEKQFDLIPKERKLNLKKLALFIDTKRKAGEQVELTFICTHNSRRSHMAQIWAQTAAAYYGVDHVISYSGGVEVTAFNPRAVKALEDVGFKISKKSESSNPNYEVSFSNDAMPIKAFSKKYDAEGNPKQGFAAVMTCSQADKQCPIVSGSIARISIPYEDPKQADGTPQESAVYKERVEQIGREITYAFSLVTSKAI